MKVLHVALITGGSPQLALRNALKSLGEYREIDWMRNRSNADTMFYRTCAEFKPDLVFMQLQVGGIIAPSSIVNARPFIKKIVNWTGDVRRPTPSWYFDTGAVVDVTLFTNDDDVISLQSRGINADYLQIGYDQNVYKPEGKTVKCPDIVFMGNNYPGTFPLSSSRENMVQMLTKRYGDKFGVYGANWPKIINNFNADWDNEAAVYRSCKIAINYSHFNLSRYSSDRLFRIMGCGAFCLSHKYKNLETEFYPGCHLETWTNLGELFSKIDHFLEDDENRKLIAKQGHKLVSSKCTWDERIKTLTKLITRY